MLAENKSRFFEHAMTDCPREACGLLSIASGEERLTICRNIAEDDGAFALAPADYLAAAKLGEVVGVVHSHCFGPPLPSDADKVGCEAHGVPWHIVSVPNGTWHSFAPSGYVAPLVGRQWAHGTLDCFGLGRDYYRQKLGIQIPDHDRDNNWWEKGQDLYCASNWRLFGFDQVDLADVREHDVLLMQVHSKVINHIGIYLGHDQFLHHLNKRLSSRDLWAGYWRKHTVKVMRYNENR
jgi:proteasome lid subunit RPN8/RPN11